MILDISKGKFKPMGAYRIYVITTDVINKAGIKVNQIFFECFNKYIVDIHKEIPARVWLAHEKYCHKIWKSIKHNTKDTKKHGIAIYNLFKTLDWFNFKYSASINLMPLNAVAPELTGKTITPKIAIVPK